MWLRIKEWMKRTIALCFARSRRQIVQWLVSVCTMLAAVSYMPCAQALVIELTFATPGQRCNVCRDGRFSAPRDTLGGGTFEAVLSAAADMWENLLQDNRLFRINVGWSNGLSSGTLAAAAITASDLSNEIIFNSRFGFFADPTPFENEEFSGYQESATDFGTGLLNSSRSFSGALTNIGVGDLLTTALHELGHVLGSPFEQFSSNVFNVLDGPFAGTQLPCVDGCGHLRQRGAVMAAGVGPEARILISGVDLLYVAVDGGFQNFDERLVRAAALPIAGTLWLCLAMLPGFALGLRRRNTSLPIA